MDLKGLIIGILKQSAISQKVVIGQCIMSSVNIALKLQEKQGIPLAPPLLISTALKYSLMCFGCNRKSDDPSLSFYGLHTMNQANMDGPYTVQSEIFKT